MMPYEPEDTSEFDNAVMERAGDLSDNPDIIIDALHKVQERMNRQGIDFDIIQALDYELSAIAERQLQDEADEWADDRAQELALDRCYG